MDKIMKKVLYVVMAVITVGILIVTSKFYINEREKEEAIQKHMSVLAANSNIPYITAEQQAKLEKEEKARKKEEEKEKKKAQEEAKRLEEQRKKEEALKIQKEAEERKKKEEEASNIKPKHLIMDVPLISQLPEYKNGCEIASLNMMLKYNGIDVDKTTLANKVIKDPTPIRYGVKGNILEWGNPGVGFVGDITGKNPGYSIDPVPLMPLLNEYMPEKALNLTDTEYSEIERILLDGRPIIVWVTVDFKEPSRPATWISEGKFIEGNFSQHAVILTGVDSGYIYYNDPLGNKKNLAVKKDVFKEIWDIMGNKALSFYK